MVGRVIILGGYVGLAITVAGLSVLPDQADPPVTRRSARTKKTARTRQTRPCDGVRG
jgi:hypothetical protein